MKAFIYVILSLIVASSASRARQGTAGIDDERDLAEVSGSTCRNGGGVVFFNVQVKVVPGNSSTQCSQATLNSIGEMVNATFVSVAMNSMPGSTVIAGVCTTPSLFTINAFGNLIRRNLRTGFVWKGGGSCKGCNPDNSDGRKLILSSLLKSAQRMFENTFLTATSNIEVKVDAEVTAGLASYPCMGTNPQVSVSIDNVKVWEVQLDCAMSSLGVAQPWI